MSVKEIEVIHDCFIHDVTKHRMFLNWSYERGEVYDRLRWHIRAMFQLPPSAQFSLTYKHDESLKCFSIESGDDLFRALQQIKNLSLNVVRNCSGSHIVKVVHGDTYHILTLPPRRLWFSFESFHGRVRNLFQLPSAAQFRFIHKEPEACGPHMIVTDADELKFALAHVSPNCLQLDVGIIEEASETNINSPSIRESSLKICHNGTIRLLTLSAGERQKLSYEQFESRIRDMFKIPRSVEFQLRYVDSDGDHITVTEGQELKDALLRLPERPLRLETTMIEGDNDVNSSTTIVQETSPYIVKVIHNGSRRRLAVAPDELQFSCEKLRSIIPDLFKLQPSAQFELSYIDEDQDNIMMVEDADLRDALVLQSLHPLKVNMKVIAR